MIVKDVVGHQYLLGPGFLQELTENTSGRLEMQKTRLVETNHHYSATRFQFRKLFQTSMSPLNSYIGWPERFEAEYNAATTPADRLGVAIRRLAHGEE